MIRLSRVENSLETLDSGESSYGEETLFRQELIEWGGLVEIGQIRRLEIKRGLRQRDGT